MNRSRLSQAESIFHDLTGHDPDEREALLSAQCAGDAELRRLVERLLANDDSDMNGFMGRPAFAPPIRGRAPLPARIGKYEIVRLIGEGGMGVVYEARQEHPRRAVALKVIRSALPSRDMLRRFRHEAEVLAQLQHPGIAHIYEAAVAEISLGGVRSEQPYFAMELIRGEPLQRYVEDRRLTVRERMALIALVCDAVQHAHQRGVIHRDLKPGNIVVVEDEETAADSKAADRRTKSNMRDSKGSAGVRAHPKILDFGVARLTDPEGDGVTLHTRAGEIVGTLSYMSPEQVCGDPTQVDTRSDVYSLGVILYELLTGRLPHDLKEVPIAEAARRIREETPPALGTLQRSFRGDVETIVSKAMHRDRARRYETAAALAADIRRYLESEPIEARRDSAAYVLGKTIQRYQWPLSAAVVFVLSLAGFAVYAWNQAQTHRALAHRERVAKEDAFGAAQRERSAKEAAQSATAQAQAARDAESEQRRLAELQAQRAASVTSFLVGTLGLADPDVTQASDMSMKTMLDRAAGQIGGAFADQPDSEAKVRLVIGRAYATLGELDAAREHLARAVELDTTILDSSPEASYEALWPYMNVLGDLGHPGYRARWWQVFRLYSKLLKGASPELAAVQVKLGSLLGSAYDPEKAPALHDEFMRIASQKLKPDDPLWLVVADFFHLGGTNLAMKQHSEEGRACLREALAIERRSLPETHTRIIRTLGELVRATIDSGRPEEAEALTQESLKLLRRTLPEDHWYVAVYRARLGACLIGQKRFEEAEPLLLDNLSRVEAARGKGSDFSAEVMERLVDLYEAWSRPESAQTWRLSLARRLVTSEQHHRPIARLQRMLGPEHADLSRALVRFLGANRVPERVAALHELLPLRHAQLADGDLRAAVVAECLCEVAESMANRNQFSEDTLAMSREADCIARASAELHPRKRAWIIRNLARNLVPRKEYVEAEKLAREALAIVESHFGENDGLGLLARSTLGAALLGQKRYVEAEPLLRAEYQRRLVNEGANDEDTHIALVRLITLFQATGRLDEALPLAYTVARSRWLEWSDIRPIFAERYPALAKAMDALSKVRQGEVDATALRLRAVLEAREAAIGIQEPVAMMYAGALHRIARSRSMVTFDPVWIAAQQEVREIVRAHLPAESPPLGTVEWWLATLMNRSGAFAEAEAMARHNLEIARLQNADNPISAPSRLSPLAGAIFGQGRTAEAEPLLTQSYDALLGGETLREPYASEYFGYLIRFYAATGRPDEVQRRVEPVLRREMARRKDALLLRRLVYHVIMQPGLPDELYQLAAEASAVAKSLAPRNQYVQIMCPAADYRAGQFEKALKELQRLNSPVPCDIPMRAALLAMTHHRLGHAEPARAALDVAQARIREHDDCVTIEDRAIVDEARRLLESR